MFFLGGGGVAQGWSVTMWLYPVLTYTFFFSFAILTLFSLKGNLYKRRNGNGYPRANKTAVMEHPRAEQNEKLEQSPC